MFVHVHVRVRVPCVWRRDVTHALSASLAVVPVVVVSVCHFPADWVFPGSALTAWHIKLVPCRHLNTRRHKQWRQSDANVCMPLAHTLLRHACAPISTCAYSGDDCKWQLLHCHYTECVYHDRATLREYTEQVKHIALYTIRIAVISSLLLFFELVLFLLCRLTLL